MLSILGMWVMLAVKAVVIGCPAWLMACMVMPKRNVDVLIPLSAFLAVVGGFATMMLGLVFGLPAEWYVMYPLYICLVCAISSPLASVGPKEALKQAQEAVRPGSARLLLSAVALLCIYYACESRGVASNGGMYFGHLDMLKFSEATGRFFPDIAPPITAANYTLTMCYPYYGLLQLLALGLGLQGHLLAFGALHGLMVGSVALLLAAVSRRVLGQSVWGYLAFALLLIGVGKDAAPYSAVYLTTPTKELTTYFLLLLFVYFGLVLSAASDVPRSLVIMCATGLVLVAGRPYTLPFVVCFSLYFLTLFKRGGGSLRALFARLLPFIPLAIVGVVFIGWYLLILRETGSLFPIGQVQGAYRESRMFSPVAHFFECIQLVQHFFFPFLETLFFRVTGKAAYHGNEVTIWVSMFSLVGLVQLAARRVKRLGLVKALARSAEVYTLLGVWVLTAFMLVPKNRMFYWATPAMALLAVVGLRSLFVSRQQKTAIITLCVLLVTGFLAPQPLGLARQIREAYRVRLPLGGQSDPFKASMEFATMIAKAVKENPESTVMMMGLEPGLDCMVLTPGRYYWDCRALPMDLEIDLENLGWDTDKCLEYLRRNNIRIIPCSVNQGLRIPFMAHASNSDKFWAFIDDAGSAIRDMGEPKDYYLRRKLYIVEE